MTRVDPYSQESTRRLEGYIPEKLYEIAEPEPSSPSTQIVSEIAARFLDLMEVDRRIPIRILSQLARVYRISPSLFWITCEILAANRQGGKSLSQIAIEQNFTKQAIHQEQVRELAALKEFMPEIAETIQTILGRTSKEPEL